MTKQHHQLDRSCNESKPIVLVEWHDARLYPDMRDEKQIEECRMQLFTSVGYLVRRDKTTTIIASEYNDEGDYREITLIPTGSILAVKELSLASGPVPEANIGDIRQWQARKS